MSSGDLGVLAALLLPGTQHVPHLFPFNPERVHYRDFSELGVRLRRSGCLGRMMSASALRVLF